MNHYWLWKALPCEILRENITTSVQLCTTRVRGKRVLDPKRVLGPFKISSTLFPLFLEPFELSSTLFPPLQEPFISSSTLFPPSQKFSRLSSTLFPPHGILDLVNLYFFINQWKMFATFTRFQNNWPKGWFLTVYSTFSFFTESHWVDSVISALVDFA